MVSPPTQAVERVRLHKRDDLRYEFRDVGLYSDGASVFTVWESVGFASDSDAQTHYRLKIGSKSKMQLFLKSEVERLCDEEGFTMVDAFTTVK
jgi:hypothetical protein